MKSFLVEVIFFANVAYAGTVTQGNIKIEKIFAGYETGELYFTIDVAPSNPFVCSSTTSNNRTFIVSPAYSDVSLVLSMLMAAKLSGTKIEVQIYDDKCERNYAMIRRVALL